MEQEPTNQNKTFVDQGRVIQMLVAKIGALELENATLKVLLQQQKEGQSNERIQPKQNPARRNEKPSQSGGRK